MKDTKKTLKISDFRFLTTGNGHYKVTYTFLNGKQISATISDMELIDATKNAQSAKLVDLLRLKNFIKNENK